MSSATFDSNDGSVDPVTRRDRTSVRGDLALFHRGLADLCRAEVPLPRALRVLQADLERGPLARGAAAMAREIEQGIPLRDAYAARERRFSPVYRALIQASGDGGGALPEVLDEIAWHASSRAWVQEKLRRTMAYPLLATGFVVLLGAAVLTFIGSPFDDGAAAASASGPGWQAWSGVLLVTLALLGALTFTALRRPLDEGVGPSGLLYKLPFLGRLRTYSAKASFAATMAMLLRRNIPLPRTFELTATATEDPDIRRRIEAMAQAAYEGQSLAEAVATGELISPSLSWFLRSAADDRAAAAAFDDVASIYRQRLERTAERVAVAAAPAAQLAVGLVVLGFALTYMTAAFDVALAAER